MSRLALATLPRENTYAAVIVDNGWVAAILAYITRMGDIYPIRYRSIALDTSPGCLPDLDRMASALKECWAAIGQPTDEQYKHLLMCPPLCSCAKSDVLTHEVRVRRPREKSRILRPRVKRDTLRKLERAFRREDVPRGYVVCDLHPLEFELDHDRRVGNPLDYESETLGLRARRVFADRDVVDTILKSLDCMGVKADVMLSAYSASGAWLEDDDRELGATVVSLRQQNSSISVYRGRTLSHVACIPSGTDTVLGHVADVLRMSRREIHEKLACNRDLLTSFAPGDGSNGRHAARIRFGNRNLESMHDAAREPARKLVARWVGEMRHTEEADGNGTGRIVLVGDEVLTMLAVQSVSDDWPNVEWIWRNPAKVHYGPHMGEAIASPLLGLLAAGVTAGPPRKEDYLTEYATLPVREISRAALSNANGACRWVRESVTQAARWAAARRARATARSRLSPPDDCPTWIVH